MDRGEHTSDGAVREECMQAVSALFPDLCTEFFETIASPVFYNVEAVINNIIDLEESGKSYTKRPRVSIKRKRDDGDDDEISQAKRRYCGLDRPGTSPRHAKTVKRLITADFPLVRSANIQKLLLENRQNLAPTYLALTKIVNEGSNDDTHSDMMKTRPSAQYPQYLPENIDDTIRNCQDKGERDILEEFRAMRLIRGSIDDEKNKDAKLKEAEERNFNKAKARGELMECECCFAEQPPNRLVHCNAETFHRFCYDCARRNAEHLVGLSKHELSCMSMDGCDAGFSLAERKRFLDEKLTKALDRIEQEESLRLAGIENLASCPFCPYAAECPPVEIDREFRCENPECKMVSCRLCETETHIPLTCEEAVHRNGVQARRQIEEAMTAALVRKCNKCNTPFIKESGCNKMMCTLKGCRNIQCYVCSKSCDYSHFNDPRRGGKSGNCPLFDVTETRHEADVRKAEAEAKRLVAEQHPELDVDALEIKMSEKVAEDDKRRQKNDPFVNQGQLYLGGRRVAAEPAGVILPGPPVVAPMPPGPPIHIGPLALPRAYNLDVPAPEHPGGHVQYHRDRDDQNNVPYAPLQAGYRRPAGELDDPEAFAQAEIQEELIQIQNDFERMMQRRAQNQDPLRRDQMAHQQLALQQQQMAQNQAQQFYQQAQRYQVQLAQHQAQHQVQHQAQHQIQPQVQPQVPHDLAHYRQRPAHAPPVLQPWQVQWHPWQQQQASQIGHPPVQKQPNQPKQQPTQKSHQQHRSQHQKSNRQAKVENHGRQSQSQDARARKRHTAPPMRSGQQGQQPQVADQGGPHWFNQLQDLSLGFGPMQVLDFGRAIAGNSGELLGQGYYQHSPAREVRHVQPMQNVNQNPAPRSRGFQAHPGQAYQAGWANRDAAFGVRYGVLGQAPAQPQ